MLPGLYSAASGLDVSIRNQEAIAHNLAHVNVPGFRRSSVAFESFESTLEEAEFGNLSSSSGVSETGYIDFTPGTYEQTGRSLDVAIKGDGFFSVEAPDGPVFTRAGSFVIGPTGQLVNHNGYPVLGEGGPIQFPADVSSGEIEISTNGQIRFRGNRVGQLQLTSFEDNQKLVPYGTTLYQAGPEAVTAAADIEIQQGYRELSNVSPTHELVQMIVGMRFYEMSSRAMNAISSAIQQNTNLQQGG